MQYILIADWKAEDHYNIGRSERNVFYVCSGTITEILKSILADVEAHLDEIKPETFKVTYYECATIECKYNSDYFDEEKVTYSIIPINRTEVLVTW